MSEELFKVSVKRRVAKILEYLPENYKLRVLDVLDVLKTNPDSI